MRVVLISRVLPAVVGYSGMLRELGHEPVALMCTRERADRYGGLTDLLVDAPAELDVVIPSSRDRIAPLLRALEPDLALCTGFPWKIPADALAVPTHGIVNGHPSLLPRYRGPSPVAWSIRNGERRDRLHAALHGRRARHRQRPRPGARSRSDDEQGWEDLEPKFGPAVGLGASRSSSSGSSAAIPGDPQDEADATLLLVLRARVRVDRLVSSRRRRSRARCARGASTRPSPLHGALTELDGETVRVLRVSLEPAEGREMPCGDGTLWIVETEPA